MIAEWVLVIITFLGTFIATLIGVFIAFRLNRKLNRKIEKIRAKRLLFLLKENIEFNVTLLHELKKWLPSPHHVVFFNLDFTIWNSLPSNLVSFLDNPKILTEISGFYYQLQHLSRKVDMLFHLGFKSPQTKDNKKRREELVESIRDHTSSILEGRICKSPLSIIPEVKHLMKGLT